MTDLAMTVRSSARSSWSSTHSHTSVAFCSLPCPSSNRSLRCTTAGLRWRQSALESILRSQLYAAYTSSSGSGCTLQDISHKSVQSLFLVSVQFEPIAKRYDMLWRVRHEVRMIKPVLQGRFMAKTSRCRKSGLLHKHNHPTVAEHTAGSPRQGPGPWNWAIRVWSQQDGRPKQSWCGVKLTYS